MVDEQSGTEEPVQRQRELLGRIARCLVSEATLPWQQLTYINSCLATYQEDLTYVRRADGSVDAAFPPDDVGDLVRELRTAMYRPEAGTWYSMTLTITDASAVDADFNYDIEPPWDGQVPSVWYAQDLTIFPRDGSARPKWLQERLADAAAAG